MKRILYALSFLAFTPLEDSFADPIRNLFPDVFKKDPGINIHPKTIGEIEGYAIEEFPETQKIGIIGIAAEKTQFNSLSCITLYKAI